MAKVTNKLGCKRIPWCTAFNCQTCGPKNWETCHVAQRDGQSGVWCRAHCPVCRKKSV